jgi:hypothetical protein
MGDDTSVAVSGEGRVELHNGSFENVLHVPKFSMNLLSVFQITQKGKRLNLHQIRFLYLICMTIPLLQLVRWITN